MADELIIPLNFPPGIQRDGTQFDADRALDALWCRWRLGRPRKMGGFLRISDGVIDVPRKIHMFYDGSKVYVHVGTSSGLQQFVLDTSGNLLSKADRTPTSMAPGASVGWTMDALFDTTSQVVQLVAHAAPDLHYVASSDRTDPFLGQIDNTTPLLPFTTPTGDLMGGAYSQPSVAGGVFCCQPFVFSFDKFGQIEWSAPNLPLYLGVVGGFSGAGRARISAQKLVAGSALRGGASNSPAAVIWSLSEVITATYVGSQAGWFAFNTISPSSSIMSTDSVIEYDGLYFWAGQDRFLVYNGTVQEVPNPQNQDWFFDNLNRAYSAKCFAFKVPRYGEIWWCAPLYGNIEPSHAIIYNVREECWYDTALPDGGRTCGYFAQGFPFPVMGEPTANTGNGYKLWLHETGTDRSEGNLGTGGDISAIRSYFETPYFGGPKEQSPTDLSLSVENLEPDILRSGDMSVYILGRANANAPETNGTNMTIPVNPPTALDQIVGLRDTRRLMRLHVESNCVNGNYLFGRNLAHTTATDRRNTG